MDVDWLIPDGQSLRKFVNSPGKGEFCITTMRRRDVGAEFLFTVLSSAGFSRFHQEGAFPALPMVNCLDFAFTVSAFFCTLVYPDQTEGEYSSCSACGHQLQDLARLLLGCPRLGLSGA